MSKEINGGKSGGDGERQHCDDGIDGAIGRRESTAYKSDVDQLLTLNFFKGRFILATVTPATTSIILNVHPLFSSMKPTILVSVTPKVK